MFNIIFLLPFHFFTIRILFFSSRKLKEMRKKTQEENVKRKQKEKELNR